MVHIISSIFKDQVNGKVKVVSRSLSNLNSISIDTSRKFYIFLCRNDEKGLFLLHSKIISDLYTWYLIDSATIDGEWHLIQNEHMQFNSQLDLNRLQLNCQFNVKQKANILEIIAYFQRISSSDNDSVQLKIILLFMNFGLHRLTST